MDLLFPSQLKTPLELSMTIKSLRRVADGFNANDGYDLRKIAKQGRKALTNYKYRKLKRFWNIVRETTRRPYVIKRPRKASRLRTLQEVSQHQDFPKGLKVAFLPADPDMRTEIKWNKKDQITKLIQHTTEGNKIVRYDLPFDRVALATDPIKEISRILNMSNAEQFIIMSGEHLMFNEGGPRSYVKKRVIDLMNKYDVDKHDCDPDDPNSSYFGNWLHGVVGFEFKNILDFQDYRSEYAREINKQKDLRSRNRNKRIKALSRERRRLLDKMNTIRAKQGKAPIRISDVPLSKVHKKLI